MLSKHVLFTLGTSAEDNCKQEESHQGWSTSRVLSKHMHEQKQTSVYKYEVALVRPCCHIYGQYHWTAQYGSTGAGYVWFLHV